jgi:hypothetical protein
MVINLWLLVTQILEALVTHGAENVKSPDHVTVVKHVLVKKETKLVTLALKLIIQTQVFQKPA